MTADQQSPRSSRAPSSPSAPAVSASAGTDRATLDSVAALAGTSRQTVSNVLNAPHLVKPETTERVRQAIDSLGYRPSRAARELRTRRSGLIAARVVPGDDEFGGSVIDTFLHALTIAADAKGYRVVLYTADDEASEIEAFEELLATVNVDAFVITPTRPHDLRTQFLQRKNVPFVAFGRPWNDLETYPWVDVDGAAGTAAAVDHLYELGHRRIGFLGWSDDRVGDDRLHGFTESMARHGLAADAIGSTSHSLDHGRVAAAAVLDAYQPTAIVCASDVVAFGLMHTLRERRSTYNGGESEDVAIVGFDDTQAARVVELSSLAQPIAEVATQCIATLAALLDDSLPTPIQHQILAPLLVVRASSASQRSFKHA